MIFDSRHLFNNKNYYNFIYFSFHPNFYIYLIALGNITHRGYPKTASLFEGRGWSLKFLETLLRGKFQIVTSFSDAPIILIQINSFRFEFNNIFITIWFHGWTSKVNWEWKLLICRDRKFIICVDVRLSIELSWVEWRDWFPGLFYCSLNLYNYNCHMV